jgi:hypothetical protein
MGITPESALAWLQGLGGRRFLLTVGNAAVNTVLLWFGKLGTGEYVTIVTLTTGAYIAAGTWQKGQGTGRAPGAP